MMMHTFYKYLIVTIAFFGIINSSYSQVQETKTIEKEYDLTQSGEFYLNNRYGDVIINGWDKNMLKITIHIIVNHKKKEQAQSLLNRFRLEEKAVGNMVTVTTETLKKNGSTVSRYFNKANPIDFNKSNVQINYTVYMPMEAAADITNKFGDIIIDGLERKVNVQMEYGDLWINTAIKTATIDMKYGKLKTKAIQYSNITLKNAELNLTSSKNLTLNSSGSKIEIEEVNSLEIISNKDEINIPVIGEIRGESKFSTMRIGSINDEIDLKMKVTTFTVAEIVSPKAFIHLEQESSDINMNITGTSFKFNAYLTEGVLRIPKTFKKITTTVIDKNDKIREINASYGNNPIGKLTITGQKGTITLKDNSLSDSQ